MNEDQTMRSGFLKSIHADTAIVGGALVITSLASVLVCFSSGYYIERDIFASQLSGYSALAFLAISILFGPLLRAGGWLGIHLDWKVSVRITKNTGIASALAALVHSGISLAVYLRGNWREVLEHLYLHAGLLALATLVLLLGFSTRPLMSRTRWHLWKPTFRLSFAAAALVFIHVLYAPLASARWTVGLYTGALVISLLRFLPSRRPTPPLAPGFKVSDRSAAAGCETHSAK